MTLEFAYEVECEACGHNEWRNSLLSHNNLSPPPKDLIFEYPDGCPKCGDLDFDKD